jgi:hypothetical protein
MSEVKLSDLIPDVDIELFAKRGYIDLSKLVGKSIRSIVCRSDQHFGYDATLMLKAIVFDDGSYMWCEGEHDAPYVVSASSDDQPNCDQETLNALSEGQDSE